MLLLIGKDKFQILAYVKALRGTCAQLYFAKIHVLKYYGKDVSHQLQIFLLKTKETVELVSQTVETRHLTWGSYNESSAAAPKSAYVMAELVLAPNLKSSWKPVAWIKADSSWPTFELFGITYPGGSDRSPKLRMGNHGS